MIDEYIKFTEYYRTGQVAPASKRTDVDWHLIPLTKIIVAPPTVKTAYINTSGQSGSYDMTAENGINLNDRSGSWQFKLRPGFDFDTIRYEMAQWIHGGYFRIDISTDEDCYYLGRVWISDWKSTERGDYITVSYVIEPFRYDETTMISRSYTFTTSSTHFFVNVPLTRMRANPLITITGLVAGETLSIGYDVPNLKSGGYTRNTLYVTTDTLQEFEKITSKKIVLYKGVSGEGLAQSETSQVNFRMNNQTTSMGDCVVTFDYIGGRI